jgi:hypothetical protein
VTFFLRQKTDEQRALGGETGHAEKGSKGTGTRNRYYGIASRDYGSHQVITRIRYARGAGIAHIGHRITVL